LFALELEPHIGPGKLREVIASAKCSSTNERLYPLLSASDRIDSQRKVAHYVLLIIEREIPTPSNLTLSVATSTGSDR
jgi:hypothetical protein